MHYNILAKLLGYGRHYSANWLSLEKFMSDETD